MRKRCLIVGPLLVLASFAAACGNTEQTKTAAPAENKPGAYAPPRTPDGQPDISGMYEPGWIRQPVEVAVVPGWQRPKNQYIDPTDFGAQQAAETDPTTSHIERTDKPMVVDPPDGRIPMQPWLAEIRKKIIASQNTIEFIDPRIKCMQSGVPRANTPVYYNSYQILQRPGYVVILYEWNHMTRIIPLDPSTGSGQAARPHLDPRIRLPMGDSRGRWEGNTLVVDVTNFTDDTWVLGHGRVDEGQPGETVTTGHGLVHSPELHVVERFTPVDKDRILYEARIEDPKAFTRPFTISFYAMVQGRPDHQLFEYACHEGNRSGILMQTGFDYDPSQK